MPTPVNLTDLRAGFAEPPAGTAPMMRWWWFGPSVDRAEVDRELAAMAGAGLGGVEIAYVYPLAETGPDFLSDAFLAELRHAADRAHALELRLDLTLGSGWSFGGPHIGPEHAARKLRWEQREVPPGALEIPLASAWPEDVLLGAWVGPGSLQESPEVLEPLSTASGSVTVPAGVGPRVVLLAYAQLTGQNVKRAALGAEGPVLDHYSAEAARHHLRHVGDPLLDAVPAELVGSVFCDSLEVYGSDWTPDLPAEFRSRRGYDLLPELYRLVGPGPGSAALRADFHQTLTELYEDNFVAEFQRWAAGRGVPFRIQGYGTPPAMISSYRHADAFEGEGWGWRELTQTRWATSAAHHYGRDVVSSEIWTWVHSPSYRATPLDLQGEAHEHLLAGINQFIGHGWPYSPPDIAGTGWFFYASGALDDRNPWWPAMGPLSRYLARLCWLMRQGEPVGDVLVHVSSRDVWARLGTATGGTLDPWREAVQLVGEDLIGALRTGGWDYDLVDDEALVGLSPSETRPVILVGTTDLLPTTARDWLRDYTAAGGSVLTVRSGIDLAGAHAVTDPAGLTAALVGTRPPVLVLEPPTDDVGSVHRHTPEADLHLVVNTGPVPRSFTATPRTARTAYEVWEPRTGRVVAAGRVADGLDLDLLPYQALVLVLTDQAPVDGDDLADGPEPGAQVVPTTDWQVQFGDEPTAQPVALPHRWEDDPARVSYSGSATYRCVIDLPDSATPAAAELDLGTGTVIEDGPAGHEGMRGRSYRSRLDPPVGVVAGVVVNGTDCGTLWAPPFAVDVTQALRPGRNEIGIVVHNTAANAVAHDEHIAVWAAESERRHGRRFRMQELDRALDGVQSGLLAVPVLRLGDPA